jgi:molybdopterin-dependent oxidoreductase alpha subunit
MAEKAPRRAPNRRVSLVPYGLNEQHPNHYKDILKVVWENRDHLGYAFRILRDGCCDGCSLGTSGMHDWTMDGIHLCNLRLQLLRLNTMPAMDASILEDVAAVRGMTEKQLRKLGRLPYPMIRRKGDKGFRRMSWEEALTEAANGLRGLDPHRLAWYVTSRGLTNEAYYAHQKVARFFGTNHIDTSARICHAPSTAALTATVGVAATTCSYSDWIGADLIVLVGSNVANNQPVSMKYLYYAKKAGTKVFVVNPYVEPGLERYWIPSVTESALFGSRIADEFFQIHAGGDVAFFHGVMKHLLEQDRVDHDFIAARTAGWEEFAQRLRERSWHALEESAGLSSADMLRFAEAFGKARHAIVVWSMGITQHRYGSDNVRALVNLQLMRGNIGRPHTGLMPIRGHSGVQGGAEMGAQPGAYMMGRPISEENAGKLGEADGWGFQPPGWKGLGAAQMVLAAERGELDAMWQSGGDFARTLPEPDRVERALGTLRLRIHQDIVASPSMFVDPADKVIVLPTRTRYEQRGGGTETSTERRIIYSPEVPGPRPGEARDEWEIPVLVARALNPGGARTAFPWRDTQDIRNEIDRLCAPYRGIAKLTKKGDQFQYGGPRLLEERCPTPDGKAHFSVVELPEERVPGGWFLLATRRGKQFNNMVLAGKDPLNGAQRDHIVMAREDAARLGVADGDAILLRNDLGEFRGRVKTDRIKPGCLQGHWPEVNVIVPAGRLDPSGVPDYNSAVEVIVTGRAAARATA